MAESKALFVDASVVDARKRVTLLRLDGVADTVTAPVLEDALKRVAAGGAPARAVVDFSKVTFVASAGWGTLISQIKSFGKANGEIRLCGMSKEVARVYHLMGLEAYMSAFDTPTQAINAPWTEPPSR